MCNEYKQLIENIKQSNLQDEDKDLLIKKLESDNFEGFLKSVLPFLSVGKEILKLFDLDIGD